MNGWGDWNLHICDGGQLLSAKWLTGIIFFPKQVILVNKIVDNLYLDRYSKQCFFVFIKKFVVNFEETKSM